MKSRFGYRPSYSFGRGEKAAHGFVARQRRHRCRPVSGIGWCIVALFAMGLVFPRSGIVYADFLPDTGRANAHAASTDSNVSTSDYRLSVRDRVRVQVFEWRPSRDEVFTWATRSIRSIPSILQARFLCRSWVLFRLPATRQKSLER